MKITVQNIIEKYDTNINIENMSNGLKNLVLFTDDKTHKGTSFDDVTYGDIEKPSHTINPNNEVYTYPIKEYEVNIKFNPNNYRTMKVSLSKPIQNSKSRNTWLWDYDGSMLL